MEVSVWLKIERTGEQPGLFQRKHSVGLYLRY
jgi:hypothetical protein